MCLHLICCIVRGEMQSRHLPGGAFQLAMGAPVLPSTAREFGMVGRRAGVERGTEAAMLLKAFSNFQKRVNYPEIKITVLGLKYCRSDLNQSCYTLRLKACRNLCHQ